MLIWHITEDANSILLKLLKNNGYIMWFLVKNKNLLIFPTITYWKNSCTYYLKLVITSIIIHVEKGPLKY